MAEPVEIQSIAEDALALFFNGASRDSHIGAVLNLAVRLRGEAGIETIIPAYDSVSVRFDPLQQDRAALEASITQLASEIDLSRPEGRNVTLDVMYGGDDGPDMAHVSKVSAHSEDEIIALHTAQSYRLCFHGFVAGFAYLGQTPDVLHIPRRDSPRVKVPAGSVGLAGWQTGIYGADGPGGWQIIGRVVSDLSELQGLQPGDTLTFRPAS